MHNFLCQSNKIFTKIFKLYQVFVAKCFKFQKHCAVKTSSTSFSSSFGMQKFHHPLGCYATRINSSFISFLSASRFLNLICQAKSLT